MNNQRPAVLCFSGHDPSGGAGVQADIETVVSHRCHCCSVITALTDQDSYNVKGLWPQSPGNIIAQAKTLLADFKISAIKIGLIGHSQTAAAIAEILGLCPGVPVVLDPVLAAGGGAELADHELMDAITALLLPMTTVLTPNVKEAELLAGLSGIEPCGRRLLALGAKQVLITGGDQPTGQVQNYWFTADGKPEVFYWQRLSGHFHGSGCTLAAAIAALLAQGLDGFSAVNEAQEYAFSALDAAYRPGQGQSYPDRLFWMES